ncbi:MAG: hypothetical protein RIB60_07545 [Phycisphaerales bacterium]
MIPSTGVFVSSVGEFRPKDRVDLEEIGCHRLYETMVFPWSGKRREILADCKESKCWCRFGGAPEPDSLSEIDMEGANTRHDAIAAHWRMVRKYLPEPTP